MGIPSAIQRSTATVSFTTLKEKPISLDFSLRGFTKAYQAFREEAAR